MTHAPEKAVVDYPYDPAAIPREPPKRADLVDRHSVGPFQPSPWHWLVPLACFAAADLCIAPAMFIWNENEWGALLVFAMLGVVFAQFPLLAAWLAWGPWAYWQRLVLAAALAPFFAVHWLAGVGIGDWIDGRDWGEEYRDHMVATLLNLPAIVMAVELPLRVIRILFGWRLVAGEDVPVRERPLAVRDLLAATVLVGLALTSARLAMRLTHGMTEAQFWLALGIGATASIVASAAIVPAVTWFTVRLSSIVLRIALLIFWALLAAAIVSGIVNLSVPLIATTAERAWATIGLSVVSLTMTFSMTGVLALARWQGMRLHMGRLPPKGE